MLVGYCRVSSVSQDLSIQIKQLEEAGCKKIYSEKISGTSKANREQLNNSLEYIREGDTLIVCKLDRLARSTSDLLHIIEKINAKKAHFKVLNNSAIDTTSSSGKLMLCILGSIAEFENDLRKERQSEGIARAKSLGTKFGRKSTVTDTQIQEIKDKRKIGVKIKDLMKEYNLSKESIYRHLRS